MVLGAVVVDARVTREKLLELLEIGAEHEELDYKSTLDLASGKRRDSLEFVKDACALANLPQGGYLVVGVNDEGEPATEADPINSAHFDSAALLQKVESYVDQTFPIVSAVHTITAQNGVDWSVAVVYVGPPATMFPVPIKKVGEYEDEKGKHTILRVGDLFVRDGTRSVRVASRHWPMLLVNHTERIKAEARSDIDNIIDRIVQQLGNAGSSHASVPIDIDMENETFARALMSRPERKRLNVVLDDARSRLVHATGATALDDAGVNALDKLAIVGATAIRLRRPNVLRDVVQVLRDIYELAPHPSVFVVHLTGERDRATAILWREILVRVIALGSLAIRVHDWGAVRSLALVPFEEVEGFGYPSWLRHGLVFAARANVLEGDGEDAESRGGLILSRARQFSISTPQVAPDLKLADGPTSETEPAGSDLVLDSACQFDILWCVLAAADDPADEHTTFYPNAAAFDRRRIDPILEQLSSQPALRDELLPGLSDEAIAVAVANVLKLARSEAVRMGSLDWSGPLPRRVEAFLRGAQ
ncbi:AlbA family DNA-binding domain-containing protein [Agromyces sp. ZXT2-3]|uniref:AlbA family DNA-binding domain-containing protein n=1 Tax=Agromyces sp. ZXT2-3 TaxID=3461152 RepID=UPI004054AAB1